MRAVPGWRWVTQFKLGDAASLAKASAAISVRFCVSAVPTE